MARVYIYLRRVEVIECFGAFMVWVLYLIYIYVAAYVV